MPETRVVNIRPDVSILSVLRHLNYRPWYALAEFVDNALESFLTHRTDLEQVDGSDTKLRVQIDVDGTDDGTITIRDNAAGIYEHEYERAFRAAEVPLDRSGLSEFGMGMKSAACWFAHEFSVRSSALGESVERTIEFDLDEIVRDKIDTLAAELSAAQPEQHYTEVTLRRLHKPPQGRTLGKIKDHLASIYRVFVREGIMELYFNNQRLDYEEPDILITPYFATPEAQPTAWRKDIDFDLGGGLHARGFAALRTTASTSLAGFALFRRNRLIEGSGDETYRPKFIFADPNSFIYQRLFGEIHLTGFDVSHTKDGFRWEENEEPFLELLKEHLNEQPVPLLDQAKGYRVRPRREDIREGAEEAATNTADVIENEVPAVLTDQIEEGPEPSDPPEALPDAAMASTRQIDIEMRGCKWRIHLELSNDPGVGDWVGVFDQPNSNPRDELRHLGVRLSLAHPFMDRFGGTDASRIEPLLRVAVALVLGETAARDSGVREAGTIRRNINELLREALSRP